jgi:hypothetical protein
MEGLNKGGKRKAESGNRKSESRNRKLETGKQKAEILKFLKVERETWPQKDAKGANQMAKVKPELRN